MSKLKTDKWKAGGSSLILDWPSYALAHVPNNPRLMAVAPEMYDLLKVWVTVQAQPDLRIAQERARELLASIDGTEETE